MFAYLIIQQVVIGEKLPFLIESPQSETNPEASLKSKC